MVGQLYSVFPIAIQQCHVRPWGRFKRSKRKPSPFVLARPLTAVLTFQKVYVYDFAGDAWSTQSTTSPPSNYGSRSGSVLDHDTNVIFTLPTGGGGMYQLDMTSVTKSASGSELAWEAVNNPSFDASSYQTTMAQASNHISEFPLPWEVTS